MTMKALAALLAMLTAVVSSCAAAQERVISKDIVVEAPAAEVWKAWTTKEGIESFFAPEAFVEPRAGGMFHIHFNPYAPAGLKGADDMRVLAVQEGKMLSFMWNAPPYYPEVRPQHTYVTVRFKPVSDNETRVTLVHGGWGDGGQWDQVYDYFNKAWGNVLGNLQKRFVEGPMDWKPFLARLKGDQDKAAEAKK
jgi:uncharacterized protein YndB with AHSA1/START domain